MVWVLWGAPGLVAVALGYIIFSTINLFRRADNQSDAPWWCFPFWAYICAVPAYTLAPSPVPAGMDCSQPPAIQYFPGESLIHAWTLAQVGTGISRLVNVYTVQYLLNAVLFAPLGAFLALMTTWSLKRIGASAALVSLSIEVIQATEWFGLVECMFRTAQLDDVILNTAGAVGGAATVLWWLSLRGKRRPIL
ncbi:VanZ like family protein [Corynebacterium atrinae]|uniref:VanZ family protein n=1 Tax=Corynebacterium atrinae TaxID=1336740 RepID=UPI00338F66DB|nr:VanZ like family protein [Corynebacterium atrinae]